MNAATWLNPSVRQASAGFEWQRLDGRRTGNRTNQAGFYVVNEDGDKPRKGILPGTRDQVHGAETGSKPGLTARQSTVLRGF